MDSPCYYTLKSAPLYCVMKCWIIILNNTGAVPIITLFNALQEWYQSNQTKLKNHKMGYLPVLVNG